MFFASCALSPAFAKPGEVPPFIQMWGIHDPSIDGKQETEQRAMIVPTISVVTLGTAASEWTSILNNLLKGQTVQAAVNNAGPGWRVLGNQSVIIHTKK